MTTLCPNGLEILEPQPSGTGPVQTCTGIALPLYHIFSIMFMILSCIILMIHGGGGLSLRYTYC